MGGFSWAEMLVIGIVALIIVGPKDLPVLFRKAGQFVGKMRGMAREFSSAMNEAADESGMRDIQKTLKTATNPIGSAMDGVKDAAKDLTNLNLDGDTSTLSPERSEISKKIQAKTARAQAERKAKEAQEALKKAEELEAAVQENKET